MVVVLKGAAVGVMYIVMYIVHTLRIGGEGAGTALELPFILMCQHVILQPCCSSKHLQKHTVKTNVSENYYIKKIVLSQRKTASLSAKIIYWMKSFIKDGTLKQQEHWCRGRV